MTVYPDSDSKKNLKNRLIFGKLIKCTKNDAIFWPSLYFAIDH